MKPLFALLVSVFLASGAFGAAHGPAGQVMLTIGGDLANPNAPGVGPDSTSFMSYLELEFADAYGFDLEGLSALGTTDVTANLLGQGEKTFTGPLLSDVLIAAGAEGKAALPMALDGYQAEISWDHMMQYAPIVATHSDGVPLALGRIGPAMIVFPVVEDSELYDSFEALQVWAMFLIMVE